MRTFLSGTGVFLGLSMLWSIGPQVAAFGQKETEEEIELAIPEKSWWPVRCIAFSPDGNLVATGHGTPAVLGDPLPGGTILWDPRTGKRVKTIPTLEDGVQSFAFSANGKTLAVLEGGGIIHLIAIPEGREIRKFQAKREKDTDPPYYSFAFFPNGERLAAGFAAPCGEPSDIAILDVASGKQILTLAGHSGRVLTVAVSPDGKLLASGAFDGTARVWDALTGKLLGTFKFASLRKKLKREEDELAIWVNCVAFSPDGRTLAAAAKFDASASVEVWDISTAKSKATLEKIDPNIQQLLFSPDGKESMAVGKEINLWDTASFKASGAIEGGCWPIALSPDGKVIAATVVIRTVLIQEMQTLDAFHP